MSFWFILLVLIFTLISAVLVLLILVQRPQGGGLTSAFGGASGAGTETVFGGRVGDALTWMTVITFSVYLLLALGLNIADHAGTAPPAIPAVSPAGTQPAGTGTPTSETTSPPTTPATSPATP